MAWIKIDKGVPLPPRRAPGTGNVKGKHRVCWKLMGVGDSVLLAGCTVETARVKLSTPRSLYGYGFAIREDDAGARVWRTS